MSNEAPKNETTPVVSADNSKTASLTEPQQARPVGVATAHADAARRAGYLDDSSYIVRHPGRTDYDSLLSSKPINQAPQPVLLTKPAYHVTPEYSNNNNYPVSQVEQALLSAKQPLHSLSTREHFNHGSLRGIYLNKHEVDQWRGPVPVESYPLHDDPNPEVIRKRIDRVDYVQHFGVRYLNPGPAPKPG
jgi:hypothetical protein